MNDLLDDGAGSVESGFNMRFRAEGGCLEVHSSGVVDTLDGTITFFRQIAAELRRVRTGALLIVDSTDGIVPDAKGFEMLAGSLQNEGFDGVKIAYVDVKGTALGRIEVGEMVARAHGYTLRTFDNEAVARIWLRYGRD